MRYFQIQRRDKSTINKVKKELNVRKQGKVLLVLTWVECISTLMIYSSNSSVVVVAKEEVAAISNSSLTLEVSQEVAISSNSNKVLLRRKISLKLVR